MSYRALATDYDGTLAEDGKVRPAVVEALGRVKERGTRLLLVTGRELDELMQIFPRIDLFDAVVAENGALLYLPDPPTEIPLAKPPPETFSEALRAHGVGPVRTGRIIVATWEPHETTVLEIIREQGLELEVIFNKGAVMVLPSGVNKGSGVRAALERLGVAASETVAIGDAENDHSLFDACGTSAAVANAIPALAQKADIVTYGARGDGVIEVCEEILASAPDKKRTPSPRSRRERGGQRA